MVSRKTQLKEYSKNNLIRHSIELEELNKYNARRLFKVVVELRKYNKHNPVFIGVNKIFDEKQVESIDTHIENQKTMKQKINSIEPKKENQNEQKKK